MPVFEIPEKAVEEVLADEPFTIAIPKTSTRPRYEYTVALESSRPFFFDETGAESSIGLGDTLDSLAGFIILKEAASFRSHLKQAIREGVVEFNAFELLEWIVAERQRLINAASEKAIDRPTSAQESSTES